MIRRLLVVTITGLTLLFVLPILLIHAQPYDSGRIGQFLALPPDCTAPCFMGVRPRHTTIQQALGILRANDQVSRVHVERFYPGQAIYWHWQDDTTGYREYGFQASDGQVVTGLTLPYDLTLGDIVLALGPPEHMTAALTDLYMTRALVILDYPSRGLYLTVSFSPCEVDQEDYWRFRQQTGYNSSFAMGLGRFIYGGIRSDSRLELDPAAWAKQLRDYCRTS